jgi:hypothetical protein
MSGIAVEEVCGACRYAAAHPQQDEALVCARFPPGINPTMPGQPAWPAVRPNWWCGEYQPGPPHVIVE